MGATTASFIHLEPDFFLAVRVAVVIGADLLAGSDVAQGDEVEGAAVELPHIVGIGRIRVVVEGAVAESDGSVPAVRAPAEVIVRQDAAFDRVHLVPGDGDDVRALDQGAGRDGLQGEYPASLGWRLAYFQSHMDAHGGVRLVGEGSEP